MASDGSGPTAPPGWYAVGDGQLRWWDGTAWGAAAPQAVVGDPTEEGKVMAALSHAGVLFGGPILPLILYLTEGQRNPYVRHHAREALNFQLTVLIAYAGAFLLAIVSMFGGAQFALGFLAVWATMLLLGIAAWVFSIIGAVKAYQRVWWRYPVALRLVKS